VFSELKAIAQAGVEVCFYQDGRRFAEARPLPEDDANVC
jgi:hypothetical protein